MNFQELNSQLLQIAVDNNYSPQQVRDATKTQVAGLLGVSVSDPEWTGGNIGFFENLKENIAREIEDKIITPKIGSIRTAIESVFPNAEYTVKKRRRVVTVYLDGKPEVEVA